ncbi:8544_t:CDS:2 [Gigaspora margarita]|uniref:8544_t:CDS:1 n=1 Tax=Gigaspora margarita TaxID=4874 RepID=A0ABN7ULW1_GIGMA|nr:8544_t:CDS:2 [Gigaspora margarita]
MRLFNFNTSHLDSRYKNPKFEKPFTSPKLATNSITISAFISNKNIPGFLPSHVIPYTSHVCQYLSNLILEQEPKKCIRQELLKKFFTKEESPNKALPKIDEDSLK